MWLLLAWAPAELAPGPVELDVAESELSHQLDDADARARAAWRLQERWTALSTDPRPCEDPDRAQLTARLRTFLEAWGRSAQSARVRSNTLMQVASAPTVVPLLDEGRSLAVDTLVGRALTHESTWLEAVAWTSSVRLPTCEVTLAAAGGIERPGVPASDDPPERVAVLATGGGVLCPGGFAANGQVVVLDGDEACVSAGTTCTCTQAPVAPGAVLSAR